MSYTEQAHKKKYCVRLACFITLVDYMIIKVLHLLIFNSITYFKECMDQHYSNIPSVEALQGEDIDILLETPRETEPLLPLFNVNLIVDAECLSLDPPEDIVIAIIKQFHSLCLDVVKSHNYFLPDPFFNPFLQPLINGKVEDRVCGYGPRVLFYISNDELLTQRTKDLFELLDKNYKDCFMYAERFQYMQQFYTEDYFKVASEIEEEQCNYIK